MYTVTIGDDGTFAAEYVVPPALSIPLGTSGSAVDVAKNEDGTFSADGEVITAETRVTAANGNVYAAVLSPAGIPVGFDHVPAMQDVMLGALGGMITLTQAEDKSWWLGEMAVADGYVHTHANGNMYRLMLDAEGMWSAMYQQGEVMVKLETQESITLVRAEDMSWWLGSEAVDVGSEVWSDNGNKYTLSYTDGVWSAHFEPESMMIEGTGLVAMTREPDDMYDVGDSTLDASGVGDVMDGDTRYHVWMQDGALAGTRFDAAIHADSAGDIPEEAAFVMVGDLRKGSDLTADTDDDFGADIRPILSSDDEDTAANELGTVLKIGDNSFSMAALLGSGMASDMGDNFVANARAEIQKARGDVDALLSLTDEPTGLNGLLTTSWARIQTPVAAR